MRILIVDDSANLRQIIRRYLVAARPNAIFSEAGNGEEAELALQEGQLFGEPIDIVFLDWMMPKMAGLEFLQRIRATDRFRTSPTVVMLTAETYPEQIAACLEFGVAAYVTKPFTQESLAEALQKAGAQAQPAGVARHAL